MKFTEELLKETQKTILKDYGVELSLAETDELMDNLTKYFKRLKDLEQSRQNESSED